MPSGLTSLSYLVSVHHSGPSSHLSCISFSHSLILTSSVPHLRPPTAPLSPFHCTLEDTYNQTPHNPETFHKTLFVSLPDLRTGHPSGHSLPGPLLGGSFIRSRARSRACSSASSFLAAISTNSFTSVYKF